MKKSEDTQMIKLPLGNSPIGKITVVTSKQGVKTMVNKQAAEALNEAFRAYFPPYKVQHETEE